MPDKFEKEGIILLFERLDFLGMESLATRIQEIRPLLTLRQLSIGVEPRQVGDVNNHQIHPAHQVHVVNHLIDKADD